VILCLAKVISNVYLEGTSYCERIWLNFFLPLH